MYIVIPSPVSTHPKLDTKDKMVMGVLLHFHTEPSPPTIIEMCQCVGISESTAKRSLKKLTDLGMVRQHRQGRNTLYLVNFHALNSQWVQEEVPIGVRKNVETYVPSSLSSLTPAGGTEERTVPIGVNMVERQNDTHQKAGHHSWSGWTEDEFPEWARDTHQHWESVAPLPRKTKRTDCLGAIYDLHHLDKFTPVEILRTCAYIACCMTPAYINSPLKLRKKTSDGTCQTFERYKGMMEAKEKEFGGHLQAGWPETKKRHEEIVVKYQPEVLREREERQREWDRDLGRQPQRARYVPSASPPVPLVEPPPTYTKEEVAEAKRNIHKYISGAFGTANISEHHRQAQVAQRNAMLVERGADTEGLVGYDEDVAPDGNG